MREGGLRIGISGLGRLGKRYAQNLTFRVRGAKLTSACSIVPEELGWARRELGVERLSSDFTQVLDSGELDSAFLVSPSSVHPSQAIQVLGSGLRVFKEKPMGGSFVHPEFEAAGDADNTIALTRFVGGKGILKIGMTPASSRVECAKDFFERFSEAFLEETQEFVDCSIQGRKPSISARDGTKATEVGFAITESFRRGCEVHL